MRIERAVMWRAQCAAVVLGGTWVALDAWLGTNVLTHMWVDVIVGGAAIIAGFAAGRCRHWCGFVLASFGVWLTMAAFNPELVTGPGLYSHNLVVGSALALVGLVAIVIVDAPRSARAPDARPRPPLRLVSGLRRPSGR